MRTEKRRRKERRTDYGKRIELLKSGKPRIVFRKSNRHLSVQYVISNESQDKIVFGLTSKELLKHGWPKETKSLNSISASYLTGFLSGTKILAEKREQPISDFGMARVLHGTRIYAFLKGLIDAGVGMRCDGEFFPGEDRIQGKYMKNDFSETFNQVKENIGKLKNG